MPTYGTPIAGSNSQHATHGSALDASPSACWIEADRAVRAAAAQQIEVAALAAGVGAGIAQKHEVAVLARDAVDAAHDLRVKRIAEVGDHRQQQAAFRGSQIAREFVDAVAACVDGGQHLVAGRGPHVLVRVQHARYGGDGNARLPRDAGDRQTFGRGRDCGCACGSAFHRLRFRRRSRHGRGSRM
jgi:hypothetical protein